jgi:hypothetical protein
MRALAPEVLFSTLGGERTPKRWPPHRCLQKRASAAKAVKRGLFYGTAEAVPFVGLSLPLPLRISEGFKGRPNWPTENLILPACRHGAGLTGILVRLGYVPPVTPLPLLEGRGGRGAGDCVGGYSL